MQLEVFTSFFYGFFSAAPLVALVGVFLTVKNSMRAIIFDD